MQFHPQTRVIESMCRVEIQFSNRQKMPVAVAAVATTGSSSGSRLEPTRSCPDVFASEAPSEVEECLFHRQIGIFGSDSLADCEILIDGNGAREPTASRHRQEACSACTRE